MCQALVRYGSLMQGYDGYRPIPKFHLALHLAKRALVCGNPKLHSTWRDESDNRTLKKCCQGASQMVFENTILTRMQHLTGGAPAASARKP